MFMKPFIIAVSGLLILLFFYESNVQVVEIDTPQSTLKNPMRGAASIVSHEKNRKLDFSELNAPFSKDTQGTEVAGALKVDDNGMLIVDTDLKIYFDYFLSSVGQVTPEFAIRRLHLLIAKNLPEQAAKHAMQVLEGYLAFKESSFDLLSQPLDSSLANSDPQYRVERLEYALNSLKTLRREHMDEDDAEGFFKEDEAFSQYTLANQRAALNTDLSIDERRELRAQAKSLLPEDMALIVQEQETKAVSQQGFQQLLKDDSSIDSLSEYAYEHFSAQEAESLVEHYQQERQLKQQYKVYREQVESLKNQGLSLQDLKQAQTDLAEQYFDAEQVSMVQAWDLAKFNK
jgi:lipase chaperone LimK